MNLSETEIKLIQLLRNMDMIPQIAKDIKDIREFAEKQQQFNQTIDDYVKNKYLDEFLPLKTALKLLNISTFKWHILKRDRQISYYQHGKKILISRKHIREYLNRHEIKSI